MNNKRPKTVTIVLLVMTVGLMLAIFYIGYVLTATTEKVPMIAPQTTKAQNASYSKFIALDTTVTSVSPTLAITASPSPTPSPTEIILAQNPTVTLTASTSGTITPSATPSKARTLPQTGFITNAIILFGLSALIIFISFIF